MLILVLITTTTGLADTIVLKSKKTFQDAWVVSFKSDPKEGPVVHSHIAEEKKLSDKAYPLTTDKITSVTFNWIGQDGLPTKSRQANMTLKDGKSYNGVSVSRAEFSNNSFGFYIRNAESKDPGDFFFVAEDTVESLYFFPSKPSVEIYYNAEIGDFYMRQGELHWELDAMDKAQLNSLSPEEMENIPGLTRETMDKLAQNIFDGQGNTVWNGMTKREYISWSSAGDNTNSTTTKSSVSSSQKKRRKKSSLFNRIRHGKTSNYLLISALLLVPSILILRSICYIEKINDVSWQNLAICAVGLAIVPPLATTVSFNFLLFLVPFFGVIFALFVYFLVSRSIIMGSMEVLETQAGIIVIVDLIFRFAVFLYFGLDLFPFKPFG